MALTYTSNKTDQVDNSRILIVEDEVIIALYIENVLHKNGYSNTTVVSSGDSCLESLNVNRPDLILMDISLDGDMDVEAGVPDRRGG